MLAFSVLLSVYYKENPIFLKQSLESVFFQTVSPTEVIIVKDGPLTDDLENVISDFLIRYKGVLIVVALPINSGLGNALRVGLEKCSFDIVARMDTDDIAKPNRFEKQLEVMENNQNIDVVGSWIDEFITEKGIVAISQRRLPESPKELRLFAKRRNPINHPTVMFRKKAVILAGGYKDFPLFEDYYLWIRMLINGSKLYNIQESLLFFRISLDVYKRRGGWKYAVYEFRLRKTMCKFHIISFYDFLFELPLRFISRVIPSYIRKYLYLYLLR